MLTFIRSLMRPKKACAIFFLYCVGLILFSLGTGFHDNTAEPKTAEPKKDLIPLFPVEDDASESSVHKERETPKGSRGFWGPSPYEFGWIPTVHAGRKNPELAVNIRSACGFDDFLCMPILYVSGTFDSGASEHFAQALLALDKQTPYSINELPVCFNSGGGIVGPSLRIGEIIRRGGFDTCSKRTYYLGSKTYTGNIPVTSVGGVSEVKGTCDSACVYAYAGGINRMVGRNSGASPFSVHSLQPSRGETLSDKQLQYVTQLVSSFLTSAGIDKPDLMDLTVSTPSHTLRRLTVEEAFRFGLANSGSY